MLQQLYTVSLLIKRDDKPVFPWTGFFGYKPWKEKICEALRSEGHEYAARVVELWDGKTDSIYFANNLILGTIKIEEGKKLYDQSYDIHLTHTNRQIVAQWQDDEGNIICDTNKCPTGYGVTVLEAIGSLVLGTINTHLIENSNDILSQHFSIFVPKYTGHA
jgi:hypothetical protein